MMKINDERCSLISIDKINKQQQKKISYDFSFILIGTV